MPATQGLRGIARLQVNPQECVTHSSQGPTPIEDKLNSLSSLVSDLETAAANLVVRLRPVVRPSEADAGEPINETAEKLTESPVSGRLSALSSRLDLVLQTLDKLEKDVEV